MKNNIKISLSKCTFNISNLYFFVYNVTAEGHLFYDESFNELKVYYTEKILKILLAV